MLIETYASDTKNPAVHACQSVFVFKDGCVDRMDTTEQMRMELDRVAKDKEENRKAKNRERKRKFRAENPEIIKARTKKYYDKNAKLLIAKSKAYYDANPDKVKTREKAHRAANPDKYTVKNKRYWTANADRLKVQNKEYIAKSADKWNNYQKEYRLANKDQISAKKELKESQTMLKSMLKNKNGDKKDLKQLAGAVLSASTGLIRDKARRITTTTASAVLATSFHTMRGSKLGGVLNYECVAISIATLPTLCTISRYKQRTACARIVVAWTTGG